MAPRLQEYAHTRLVKRRVKIRPGSQVQAVGPGRVVTSADGALATHTVVWAAGVRGDPAVGAWGLPVGRSGRVPVEETLQVPGHPEVFVVGDLAYLESGGTPLPQVAQVALQQGAAAADNIVRLRASRRRPGRSSTRTSACWRSWGVTPPSHRCGGGRSRGCQPGCSG